MASVFNKGKYVVLNAAASFTYRALLVNSGYTYNKDHNYVSDVTGEITLASSYSRQTLTSVTAVEDDANDRAELQAASVEFGPLGVGETVTELLIFQRIGGSDVDATDLLVSRVTILPTATNGQDFTVNLAGGSPGSFYNLLDS